MPILVSLVVSVSAAGLATPQERPAAVTPDARLERLKAAALAEIDNMATFTQRMVDQIFSFGELGFQEVETSGYLVDLLRQHGFTVEEGIAGIPTAWMATWGSGRPVIALGSDIDAVPKASQKPGVAYHDPLIEGGPGHGEGHNSGQAVNVTAAIVLKKLMEREKIGGTLRLWPGVAEELLATKAWFVRDGYFKDTDVVLFSHVSDVFDVYWGSGSGNGLVSVEYQFGGESAHSAGAPWRGKSALDAVELMNIGWNFRREHLRIQQRSHYVVTNGGDQPNVVPPTATVWYYFRETDYAHIKAMWEAGNAMAQGAALMTNTTHTSRILGAAWPQHMNKVVAETMHANIRRVGMPAWSEADQTLAKALQAEIRAGVKGLELEVGRLDDPVKEEDKRGGGSDDIGDISWVVPTITLEFPANIPNLPGHHWSEAVAMATPIAHKGSTAGAKAQALTILDLLLTPGLVDRAWQYYRDVQTRDQKYIPFIDHDDPPATWLNARSMAEFRPKMKPLYFDPSKHQTYLEQLGITYPTVGPPAAGPD
jgi:aminobenzoyl-glutamate utilization protein B